MGFLAAAVEKLIDVDIIDHIGMWLSNLWNGLASLYHNDIELFLIALGLILFTISAWAYRGKRKNKESG